VLSLAFDCSLKLFALSLDKLHVISIDSVAVEGDTVAIVVFDVEELFELAIETFLFLSVLIEHSFLSYLRI
jgi:hypothetical protein